MKFAPDTGQLQKAGGDAAKIVKDFKSITAHMHLKDYKGWEHFQGYCPLGEGKVDLQAILDTMEEANPQREHHARARWLCEPAIHGASNGGDQQDVLTEARLCVQALTKSDCTELREACTLRPTVLRALVVLCVFAAKLIEKSLALRVDRRLQQRARTCLLVA